MARRYLQKPTILLDPGKGRVRIYKCTLHSLGDPEYILLIVNPFDQSITVMRSEKSDQRAYHLGRTLRDNHRSPEIFCKSLLRNLFTINTCWDKKQSYRIFGKASLDGNAVTFGFVDSVLFLGEREWQ